MQPKAQVMDAAGISRAVARITHEIIERNRGAEGICLLGVRRRGEPLAGMLADNIERFEGLRVPVGYLDITYHRDDLTEAEREGVTADCHIPCDVSERTVILVDDVLYTGRTARAAMESVFANGRDYVGKNVPTSKTEKISVLLDCIDGESAVYFSDIS